jgi:alkylation response protein AidB-like acyl-CoA dehydrogenase
MDFSLTEDQQAIVDLARQIFTDRVTDDYQRTARPDFDRPLWQTLAASGLVGVAMAERNGGSAMGFIAQCLVVKAMGAVLAQLPLLQTQLAAWALEQAGQDDGLAAVAAGEAHLTLSLDEGLALAGNRLRGRLALVPFAAGAQQVLARAGDTLVSFNPGQAGVTLTPQHVSNGRPGCLLELDSECRVVGDAQLCDALVQRQQVASAWLQLGVAEEALRRTASYTSERRQFGRPLAAFQAVSHRAADGYIDVEALRAVCESAAWRIEAGLDAVLQSGAARWWASEVAHRVSHTAQHLHGGIGADLEYPIHRYFLWSKQLEFDLPGARHQLAAMGEYLAANPAAGVTL